MGTRAGITTGLMGKRSTGGGAAVLAGDSAACPAGIETLMGGMVMEQNLLTADHKRILAAMPTAVI